MLSLPDPYQVASLVDGSVGLLWTIYLAALQGSHPARQLLPVKALAYQVVTQGPNLLWLGLKREPACGDYGQRDEVRPSIVARTKSQKRKTARRAPAAPTLRLRDPRAPGTKTSARVTMTNDMASRSGLFALSTCDGQGAGTCIG
jgi:hypothetical protein